MAKFFDDVKMILNDVEQFLPQVKDSKLNTQGRKMKIAIQQQIVQIRNEKPQLGIINGGTNIQQANDISVSDDSQDLYEDTESILNKQNPELLTKNVPASDRENLICEGKLKYRKEKKSGNKVKYQKTKQWCVLRANLFYIYDKSSSKKQVECFFVDGYQVTPMEKEVIKKEELFPFEMIQEEKKTYVLLAATAADQKLWVDSLKQVTGIVSRQRPVTVIDDDLYDDMETLIQGHSNTPSGESFRREGDDEDECLYDETGPNMIGNDDDPEAIYDSTEVPLDGANQNGCHVPSMAESNACPPPVPVKGQQVMGIGQTGEAVSEAEVTSLPRRGEPATPNYAEMYYGMWDNDAEHPQELAFKRGDIVTILSRQFEAKGWWVGELGDRVGLVPTDYMTPAYERV